MRGRGLPACGPRVLVYCAGMPLTPGSQLGVFTITAPSGSAAWGKSIETGVTAVTALAMLLLQ